MFGSISFLMTEISVVSITRRMNNTQAITNPHSMAMVKSKITVRKNVINKTVTSDLGFFNKALKVRQPLMLYDTITSTPAKQAIGMYCANGIRSRRISSNTAAWIIPAIGVLPPLLMLVMVRAIAPVAGIPPKIGVTTLAIPWAISSVFESCLSPITPSATAAESKDSIAPNTAMVMATGKRFLMASQLSSGTTASGSCD